MDDIFLRKATEEDVMLIFQWANDPEVRRNSFQTKQIDLEDHKKWYDSKIKSANSLFYILMNKDIPVGQIRLELEGNCACVNYSIAAPFRGKGMGKEMLRLAETELKGNYPHISRLVAEVKEENSASKHAFEREGYHKNYVVYEKELLNE